MAPRNRAAADLTGIRQRGGTFQVRVFIGNDPVTGKKVMVTGSADTQSGAIELRDESASRYANKRRCAPV
jgi:hypothetical protein